MKVTLEQLLQHRGGAPGTMPADIWSQMRADGSSRAAKTASLGERTDAKRPRT